MKLKKIENKEKVQKMNTLWKKENKNNPRNMQVVLHLSNLWKYLYFLGCLHF